ncbi:MAG: hypothetical protein HZA91_16905 [Verrucomicrobia bacterium]|nr:hypothetical protein [Verrucomicrobiota bacterium]
MNEFEKRIAETPPRRVPAAWRDDILAAARREQAPRVARPSLPDRPWWLEWLWPNPVAWGTLAAAWVVIFALHAATPASSGSQTASASNNTLNLIVKRQQELSSLLATVNEPAPPKAVGPRSELQRDHLAGRGDTLVAPIVAQPSWLRTVIVTASWKLAPPAATGMSPLPAMAAVNIIS